MLVHTLSFYHLLVVSILMHMCLTRLACHVAVLLTYAHPFHFFFSKCYAYAIVYYFPYALGLEMACSGANEGA